MLPTLNPPPEPGVLIDHEAQLGPGNHFTSYGLWTPLDSILHLSALQGTMKLQNHSEVIP